MSTRVHRDADEQVVQPRTSTAPVAAGRRAVTALIPGEPLAREAAPDPDAAAGDLAGLLGGPRDERGVTADAGDAVAQAASSVGAPLPADVRVRFEGSLGADLSGVRIHTGAASAGAAAAVGAHAYTTGQDIHFAAGRFRPDDPFGMHLLAHEVAHTVQQRGGGAPARQHKLEVSMPGDPAEVEADRAADAMVAGRPAEVAGGPTIAARATDPAAAAGPTGAPDQASDAATAQADTPTKPTVTVKVNVKAGAAIEYDAATYAELYKQVMARAATNQCAGSCTCGAAQIAYQPRQDGKGTETMTIEVTVTTSLPSWKQRATASREHQEKFDRWLASVKVHEDAHAKLYKDGFAGLKTLIKGPKDEDCDSQYDKALVKIEEAQTTFDADKSKQPAPLDIPGGTSKIGADGKETPQSDGDAGAAASPTDTPGASGADGA